MDIEIREYQSQLANVVEALLADPDNPNLKTLKDELNNLISLTTSLAHEQASSGSSISTFPRSQEKTSLGKCPFSPISQPSTAHGDGISAKPLAAGESCLAKYAADGRWYPARVTSVGGSAKDPVYSIIFKGYNNTEMLRSADVKSVSPPAARSSASSATKLSPVLSSSPSFQSVDQSKYSSAKHALPTPEEEAEQVRKRKRNEKKGERRETKNQVANEKANSWQKFAKKGQKKGYVIPGSGSMFKTPDDPLAKVGVVGAGRGMTQYQDRTKHVYQP